MATSKTEGEFRFEVKSNEKDKARTVVVDTRDIDGGLLVVPDFAKLIRILSGEKDYPEEAKLWKHFSKKRL